MDNNLCSTCGEPLAPGDKEGMCGGCWAEQKRTGVVPCPFTRRPKIAYCGRPITPTLISCPSCGRTHLRDPRTGDTAPFVAWAEKVEAFLRTIKRPLKVAVMGCEVNGPGEATEADIGIALGKTRAAIFKRGVVWRTVPLDQCLDILFDEIGRTW